MIMFDMQLFDDITATINIFYGVLIQEDEEVIVRVSGRTRNSEIPQFWVLPPPTEFSDKI